MKKVMAMFLSLLLVLSIPVAAVFAQVTKSYDYKFINRNPIIGVSSASTEMSNIQGNTAARDCLVQVRVDLKNDKNNKYRFNDRLVLSRLTMEATMTTRANSDTWSQITSRHWTVIEDGYTTPLSMTGNRTTRGTTSGTRSNPNW